MQGTAQAAVTHQQWCQKLEQFIWVAELSHTCLGMDIPVGCMAFPEGYFRSAVQYADVSYSLKMV